MSESSSITLAYVLEPKLQKSGVKIPNWASRSHFGIHVGFSKVHSSLVGLILNQATGSISSHFHVVYDDLFTTVYSKNAEVSESWRNIFTLPSACLQIPLDEEDDPELQDEGLTEEERHERERGKGK